MHCQQADKSSIATALYNTDLSKYFYHHRQPLKKANKVVHGIPLKQN